MGRVQLYCPSTNKTIDDFVIGAYQSPGQVLQGVRLALDIKHAALYTIEAKPISDPHSLQEDQRVLVATSKDEIMLPDAPYGYVRYDGEEMGDIDPDLEGYGLDWQHHPPNKAAKYSPSSLLPQQDLTDTEKRLHITFLSTLKPTTRNKLRITREYAAVRADLLSIQQSDLSTENKTTTLSTAQHEDLIQDRWGIPLEHFLRQVNIPPAMKYPSYGTKAPCTGSSSSAAVTASSLTPATIAALAALASFSHGQAKLVGEVLSEAVAMRLERKDQEKEMGLREDDVGNAIEIVYERAGIVPVKLTAGKKTRKRAKGRAARKAESGA
ncbi:uncharacterized protein yc1106_08854 [Curvularia clavata]|uniref:Uncharacterized protein n=1 Tax=Curvularia clavata TaxID=95742 RepID=A0A9Q9DX45_CURCL|nr:uncharacterized protein yc1106_08854 [Curvularia clavata]